MILFAYSWQQFVWQSLSNLLLMTICLAILIKDARNFTFIELYILRFRITFLNWVVMFLFAFYIPSCNYFFSHQNSFSRYQHLNFGTAFLIHFPFCVSKYLQYGAKICLLTSFKDTSLIEIVPRDLTPTKGENSDNLLL